MLRVAVRATAASLGLAIFVDVPSKNQPHALKLKRADAAGATYRGVAANATQSSLRNFQLSLDAVFAPCDEATFEALKSAYGGWSASRSAVAWEAGRDFRLSDLLPPLAQALCGRRFTPTTSGDVLCNANCWGFAYSVLEAAAAPSDSVTVSAGAHGDAWAALVAVTDRVQSTLEQGHDLLGDQRNAALAPGDVLMLWHQNTGEEERYLDHVAILVDDDLYLEKAGSGAETPFRLIDWDGLVASWPPAVFEWDWRRRKRGTAVPPARQAFGSKRVPEGVRADALAVAPYAGTEQLSWVKTLDEPLTRDERGRAALPPAAFDAAAFAVVDGADPSREPTKAEVREAKWTPLSVDGPSPLGRVPAATCVFGGGLYIFGGETDDTRPWVPIPNRYLNDVWRLDLRSGRWEELSPDGAEGAPDPRVCAAAVASDAGEIVMYGGLVRRGKGGDHVTVDDMWTFSPATRRWTRREATGGPGPLTGHAACRLRGDRALVFGGTRPEAEHSNETWVLDLKTCAWTRRAPGPAARDFHLLLPAREGALMWGGVDDGAWRYCAETDKWSKDADLPYLSGRAGVALGDGTVVAFGGMDVAQGVAAYGSDVLVRRGAAFSAVDADSTPPGRCFPALAAAPDGSGVFMFGGYRRVDGEAQERLGDVWRLELRPAPPRTTTPPYD